MCRLQCQPRATLLCFLTSLSAFDAQDAGLLVELKVEEEKHSAGSIFSTEKLRSQTNTRGRKVNVIS